MLCRMRFLFRLVVLAAIVLAVIQVIPYGRDHSNPKTVQEIKWNTPETRALAQDACFACHSNLTDWPWYTNVAPISWLTEHDVEDELLWVDFNDLDIEDCWVIGQNSTCPYQDQKVGQGREVVVPTVAAVVVFVLAILTVFIKCAANRRNTRRRRKRVDDGWDYEGVPS